MHLSIKYFLFFTLLVLFFNPMRSLLLASPRLFELHSLALSYLTFLGDSHIDYGTNAKNVIALTKEGMPTDTPKSTGMVLYSRPILFQDQVPSFSTMFAFSIKNMYDDGEDPGDGLAFLISPNVDLLGSPGYLGLVDSTGLTRNKFIAIEFDTKCDLMFQDPDDNHLGLDINSLSSVQLATSSSLGVNLNSGDLIYAWIDYQSDETRLEVFLSYLHLKPANSILKVDIDLSNYLKKKMFVGFSAGTEGSMQSTRIERWEFTIVGFNPPPAPPPSPSPESGRTFPNPSESRHRDSYFIRLAIGLTVGASSVPIVVLFGWFCWKKLIEMIQKLEGTNNLEMQTIGSSGGNSEIRFSIPVTNPDEVAKGLIIEKVLDNEAELIRVKKVNFTVPDTSTICR